MKDQLSLGRIFERLEHAVGLTQRRHSVITGNISHLDTPHYKPKEIDFKQALHQALEPYERVSLVKTDPNHIGPDRNTGSGVEPCEEDGEWNGFNWVNIDHEMTKLIENDLMYRTAVETLIRKIILLKEIIREGGR